MKDRKKKKNSGDNGGGMNKAEDDRALDQGTF